MRRFLKGLLIAWGAFWALLFLALLLAALLVRPVKSHSVVRIVLDGELAPEGGPSLLSLFGEERAPSLRSLCESIRYAATDPRIDGLVLVVREPELGVAAIEEIEQAMALYRASGKWSAAYLETAGELGRGDGAYALACTASTVVLAPSGSVNLSGLRLVVPFVKNALERLEIQPTFSKRYDYKTAPEMFTQSGFTPAHLESLASLAQSLQGSLAELVAERRKVEPSVVMDWIRAGPHPAKDALERHLVDSLGYWDTLVDGAEQAAGREDCFVDIGTYSETERLHTRGPELALIWGEGDIERGEGDLDERSIGADTMVQAFRDAREAGVKGILFRVDSPGGSYVASDLIRREVQLTREASIPVVVSMGDYAASGGYFVALDADRIIAEPGTITGSIGVYGGVFATRKFWERWLGVTFGEYETVPDAVDLSFLDPPDARSKAALDAELDRIYTDFVTKAAAGRKKSYDEIHAVAKGRVWSGKEALARGLVDELGGLEVALTRLKELAGLPAERDVELKEFPGPESPLRRLARALRPRLELSAGARRVVGELERLAQPPGERVLALPVNVRLRP